MKALCFFAKGFEEVEALATINLLKRAGVEVKMIGLKDEYVESARKIIIKMDLLFSDLKETADCYILPGGMPGASNLADSDKLKKLITEEFNKGKLISAICAAPVIVLDKWALLKNKKITCYNGMQKELVYGTYINEDVVIDKNLITSRGVGTVFEFGFAIIKYLLNSAKVDEVKKNICYSN